MNRIEALYTLSNGDGNIFISKGKIYEVNIEKDNKSFIYDNTGEKMYLNKETLSERFKPSN